MHSLLLLSRIPHLAPVALSVLILAPAILAPRRTFRGKLIICTASHLPCPALPCPALPLPNRYPVYDADSMTPARYCLLAQLLLLSTWNATY